MWFKHRAWIPVAWVLCLVNVVAVWFAARPAEPWHASIHALLAVLFGLGAQRLGLRRQPIAVVDVGKRLRELETRQNEATVRCRACDEESPENFETCWACGAMLPMDGR